MLAFWPVSTWDPFFVGAIHAHYTNSDGPPPGKKLAWIIYEDGRYRGVIGMGEPSFKLAPRRRLGLDDARPLPHTVSCFIFRVEAPGASTSSDILKAWHPIAAVAWRGAYGWTPEHWETLIGHVACENPGACFRRAGYRSLGLTTGRGARRPEGASRGARVWGNGKAKLVLYRGPLARRPVRPEDRLPAPRYRNQTGSGAA